MTPEEKEHEMMRRELWIKVAVAIATNTPTNYLNLPAHIANRTLEYFDEQFKPIEPKINIKD